MLPGPPRECNPMWKECAMPYLYKLAGGCIVSHNIRVFGLGESSMEHILHDMMEKSKNPTIAPYAKTSGVLRARHRQGGHDRGVREAARAGGQEIVELLGDDVYGVDVDSLEQVVGDGLRAKGLKLAVAESCTGGLLSKRITDIPGCSDYYLGGVCSYANEVKMNVLGVRKETLDTVGAVSAETAEQMAAGVAKALGADIGVGITGIAGRRHRGQAGRSGLYQRVVQRKVLHAQDQFLLRPRPRQNAGSEHGARSDPPSYFINTLSVILPFSRHFPANTV